MKPKIVEFENGQYGVLVSHLPPRFLELKHPWFDWRVDDEYFEKCAGSLSVCRKALKEREKLVAEVEKNRQQRKIDFKIKRFMR